MNEIQTKHGKLLFITQSLYKRGRISIQQKDFIKMKIINKDPQIFLYLDNYISSRDINRLEDCIIIYSNPEQISSHKNNSISKNHQDLEESAFSNKAKKTHSDTSDSDDELDEAEEDLLKEKKAKERTKSEQIDLRRASFTDYFKFVKDDLYQHSSANELESENKAIIEVKSHMEMSKGETHRTNTPKDPGKICENNTPNSGKEGSSRQGIDRKMNEVGEKVHENSKFKKNK